MWRSRLWRKYAWVTSLLVTVAIAASGGAELVAVYGDANARAGAVQLARARQAANAISAELGNIDRHVATVTDLPWGASEQFGLALRREEYARLLKLLPSVESVAFVERAGGRETLFVSRRELDRMGPGAGAAAMPARPDGAVEYQDDYDPLLQVRVAAPEPDGAGTTVVRIGLRALVRELGDSLLDADAAIFAVDETGTVVLHRDPGVLLARHKLAEPPPLQEALAQRALGLAGDPVVRSVVPISRLGWRVVVEQSRATLMAPVRATLWRTVLLLSAGIVLAIGAALVLAGRMTRPVMRLHAAASEIGAGRLRTAIALDTHDELEDLANQFNRMAESLQASYAGLEARVAEKTRDLERANRHKSEFLANMSHELRTPLNAILGFADVLRDGMAGALTDAQKEFVADIHTSGLHLLALINDVLDLSKIEAGQLALEPSEIFVPETIDAAAAFVRQRCVKQGIRLSIEVAPEVGIWVADPRRFKQVLLNLLSNATKFTPSGGEVAVRAWIDPEQGLVVEVRDTGIGIDPADHAKVFEEFRQVGGPQRRAEGTGLGLSLVRRLVEQHGGCVTLESRLGEGATFRFNIPRTEA